MRHLLLPVTLFAATCCAAQTNVYHPFLHEDASWGSLFRFWYIDAVPEDTINQYRPICLDGDTMFDGKEYVKVKIGYDCSSYRALIREDVIEKKVFVNYFESDGDTLLYDFSLTTGESANHCYTFAHFDSSKVIGVDSIMIGDDYRKKFMISCYNLGLSDTTFWIEGIGGVFGPAPEEGPEYFGYGNFEDGIKGISYLICYQESGGILYEEPFVLHIWGGDSIEFGCDYVVNIDDNPLVSEVKLFPNPVSGNLMFIKATIETQCIVYSMSGQKMLEQQISEQGAIDVSNLTPGLYMVVFGIGNNQTINRFFVKL